MSTLQKLEKFYACLMRLLTVACTLALLVGAVLVGIHWLRATAAPAEADVTSQSQIVPKVSADELVKHIVSAGSDGEEDPIAADDTNRASYDRIRKVIDAFASKHAVRQGDMDVAGLLGTVQEQASSQVSTALTAAYVSGLADGMEHALSDPKIEAMLDKARHEAAKDSTDEGEAMPASIVSMVISQYDTAFARQLSLGTHNDPAAQAGGAEQRKADWLALARLGGPLLLLVLVLQLLTFGRIEQNTRDLFHKNAG